MPKITRFFISGEVESAVAAFFLPLIKAQKVIDTCKRFPNSASERCRGSRQTSPPGRKS
jgi:hypothetical protein